MLGALRRQREIHCRALANLALRPDAAVVLADDPVGERQPYPGGAGPRTRVQRLEGQEQLVIVAHVEALAVIAHVEHALALLVQTAHLYAGIRNPLGEGPGVGDELLEQRVEEQGVPAHHQVPGKLQGDLAVGILRLELLEVLPGEVTQVEVPQSQLNQRDLRQQVDLVEQLAHPPGAGADAVEDRKSTRLNSSHVAISYAVFCLKKKTTYTRGNATRYTSRMKRGIERRRARKGPQVFPRNHTHRNTNTHPNVQRG